MDRIMKLFGMVFLIFFSINANAQDNQKIKVLTLGTFHFAFPNLDVIKTDDKDIIDVLQPEYQKEIESIVKMIAVFEPTIIAIEVDPIKQEKIDSVYMAYLSGTHKLKRSEHEQLGFRLAKQFNLQTLHCTNNWGELPEEINNVVYGNDTISQQDFMNFFYNNNDSSKIYDPENKFKSEGILEHLKMVNSKDHLKMDLGNYMISIFKYQTNDNEFFGVDFTTGWWFNRNLRIFRNIQKIPAKPNDRILVIYGSSHMNLLNIFFDASPEYELENINDYLE
jgi:hypothetical protein